MDKHDARNRIGGAAAGNLPPGYLDNVGIALATYFDSHPLKPEGDEQDDSGWHPWVSEQVDAALDNIAAALGPNARVQPP